MSDAVQLNSTGWFIEEERKTEDAINHIRNVLGTFKCEQDPAYHFLIGYLNGLKRMYAKFEDDV